MFLRGHDFNTLIKSIFQRIENRFISLVLKAKQQRGIQLSYIFLKTFYGSILQSIFVISSFSWFMKLIVIYVEGSFHIQRILFLTRHESDLNLLLFSSV